MKQRLAAFLAAILYPVAPALAGGPPFVTDDAFVLAPGEAEFIPYLDWVAMSGSDQGEAGLDASIGIAEGLQLGFILPLQSFDAGNDHFGPGDAVLQGKLALPAAKDAGLSLAFGPALVLPTASGGRAEAGLDVPLWLTAQNGVWSLHAGGGYRLAAEADGGSLPFGGIVAKRSLGSSADVGFELFAEGGGFDGEAVVMAGPGMAFALSDKISLVAASHAILTNRATNGDVHFYAALMITP